MDFIKRIVFHFLLAIRGIVRITSKLLAFMFIFGFIGLITVSELQSAPLAAKIMSLIFGIFFTLVNWLYDDLLFYFKPEKFNITLVL